MSLTRNIDIEHRITNPTYLSDRRIGSVASRIKNDVTGVSINFNNKTSAILASMGEFFERERLMPNKLNRKLYPNNLIEGYSLIDKKSVHVDISRVIATGSNFTDTCGLASHTNSSDCIFNAIKEFIERQSLIFNYLSKGNAKLINYHDNEKFNYIFQKMNDIKLYEISLIEDYYVVLAKGVHNGKFYIGLGSSNDIDNAIYQSIIEICQLEGFYSFKDFENQKIKENRITGYGSMFSMLPINRIIDAYGYLDKSCINYNYRDFPLIKFSIDNIFNQLNDKYSMNPLIFYLEPLRDIETLKVVKVVDLNWFPNLYPKSYDKVVYDFIEKVTNTKLDRECTFIPFP